MQLVCEKSRVWGRSRTRFSCCGVRPQMPPSSSPSPSSPSSSATRGGVDSGRCRGGGGAPLRGRCSPVSSANPASLRGYNKLTALVIRALTPGSSGDQTAGDAEWTNE